MNMYLISLKCDNFTGPLHFRCDASTVFEAEVKMCKMAGMYTDSITEWEILEVVKDFYGKTGYVQVSQKLGGYIKRNLNGTVISAKSQQLTVVVPPPVEYTEKAFEDIPTQAA